MTNINASDMLFSELNEKIRICHGDCTVNGCLGQRFIAAGLGSGKITLVGTPGNALGAYLNGAEITVRGNAQDATGDTMNGGVITVHGSIGDAAGYAMRGGVIYVKGSAGYRAGIHMKQYGDMCPVIVIGGVCGSFAGEYQAGGMIIILGLNGNGDILGDYPCTGMHGGMTLIRSDCRGIRFPRNVSTRDASADDMQKAHGYITKFCDYFGYDKSAVLDAPFTAVTPDSKNPYKQMYVAN